MSVFEGCKICLHFFVYVYPAVPLLFVEKTVFSPSHCFCSFVKDQLTIFVGSISRLSVLCNDISVYFFTNIIYLQYFSFIVSLEVKYQASLSITNSQGSPKLMSIESVMPSNHLILCHPLLLLLVFPSIRGFSNESVLHIR